MSSHWNVKLGSKGIQSACLSCHKFFTAQTKREAKSRICPKCLAKGDA